MAKRRSFGAEISINRKKNTELSFVQKSLIVDRLSLNHSQASVAAEFRVHPATISRIWKRYQTTGSIENKPRSGRPNKLTETEKHHVIITAKRNRKITWNSLMKVVPTKISRQTLRRTIQQQFRRKWLAKRRIRLTNDSATKRLHFAKIWRENIQDLLTVS